jgi:hypothetical protein
MPPPLPLTPLRCRCCAALPPLRCHCLRCHRHCRRRCRNCADTACAAAQLPLLRCATAAALLLPALPPLRCRRLFHCQCRRRSADAAPLPPLRCATAAALRCHCHRCAALPPPPPLPLPSLLRKQCPLWRQRRLATIATAVEGDGGGVLKAAAVGTAAAEAGGLQPW